MTSTLTTSLLLPADYFGVFGVDSVGVQILNAEPTATTYLLDLDCFDGSGRSHLFPCGSHNASFTLGPWASETPPPGAPKTGEFDLFVTVSDSVTSWRSSVHCDVSKTVGKECTTFKVGNGDTHLTATFTSFHDLDEVGLATFAYFPFTITAGLDLIATPRSSSHIPGITTQSSATDASSLNSGAEASSTENPGAKISGGTERSSSASAPEATSGAAAHFNYLITIMSVAGIVICNLYLPF